jgi:predicted neutral ceramidase superfamily lipid hydrolase
MAVSFHFRDPFLPNVIILFSFILLLVGSIVLKKRYKLKGANLLIIGSTIAFSWFVIDLFIPGIILPSVPSSEDIEFTRIYGMILNGLIRDIALILGLGILPLLVFFMNRSSNSILFLALGAVMQIISILLGFDADYLLLSAFSLATTAFSMAFFAYYGYKIKNYFIFLFSLSFFMARLLYLLMI